MRGTADSLRTALSRRLRRPYAASLRRGCTRASGERFCGEQLLQRPHADGVLLPHDGRTRGTRRYRGEDGGDGIHEPTSHEGSRGSRHFVRWHGSHVHVADRAVPVRRRRTGSYAHGWERWRSGGFRARAQRSARGESKWRGRDGGGD